MESIRLCIHPGWEKWFVYSEGVILFLQVTVLPWSLPYWLNFCNFTVNKWGIIFATRGRTILIGLFLIHYCCKLFNVLVILMPATCLLKIFFIIRINISFNILAYVIMPSHFHWIIEIDNKICTVSEIMRDIKKYSAWILWSIWKI